MLLPLLLMLAMKSEVALSSLTHISSRCGENVVLPCGADFNADTYLSVTWYKGNKEGILRRSLTDKKPSLYNFGRKVILKDDNSLQLDHVTAADSGKYECLVSARVGSRNLNHLVQLTVQECEAGVTTESMAIVQKQGPQGPEGPQKPHGPEGPQKPHGPEQPQKPHGSEGPEGPQRPVEPEGTFLNETNTNPLPLAWSLGGYSAVAFTKITLSILIIWIFHICSRRKRRLER